MTDHANLSNAAPARARFLVAGACAAAIVLGGGAARAQMCDAIQSINTNCWNDYSGQNFGQVAAGHLQATSNRGLVCAVTAGSDTNWGGSVFCYKPVGSNGAAEVAIALAGSPLAPFSNSDPNLRIVSLAVVGSGPVGAESFVVYVLRGDNNVFFGTVPFPYYPETRNLEFTSTLPPQSTTGETLTFRSIAVMQGGFNYNTPRLHALTTDNRVFQYQPGASPPWAFVAAGNFFGPPAMYIAPDGIVLKGSSGLGTDLAPLPDVPAGEAIRTSNANANSAFKYSPVGFVGMTTPVGMGYPALPGVGDAWLLADSSKIFHSTVTRRLVRSPFPPFNQTTTMSYGPWTVHDLPVAGGIFPWSIADAGGFRGTHGEFFAIGRGAHLLQYVPPSARWETETMTVAAKSSDTHTTGPVGFASDGQVSNLQANLPQDFVTYVSPSIAPGTYKLTIRMARGAQTGIVQFSMSAALNGTYINYGLPQDTFNMQGGFMNIDLGYVSVNTTGPQYFRMRVTGKNAASSGHQLFPDYVQLAL